MARDRPGGSRARIVGRETYARLLVYRGANRKQLINAPSKREYGPGRNLAGAVPARLDFCQRGQ